MTVRAVRPLSELVDGDPLVELDACWSAAWSALESAPHDVALFEACRRRMAEILGYPIPAAHRESAEAAPSVDALAAGIALTEHYLIDVSATTDSQVSDLAAALDGSVVDFVTALLVAEQRMRLELALSAVLVPVPSHVAPSEATVAEVAPTRVPVRPTTPARAPRAPGASRDTELGAALMRFAAAAVRNDGVDPVTTELVRLRCATYHDCHT